MAGAAELRAVLRFAPRRTVPARHAPAFYSTTAIRPAVSPKAFVSASAPAPSSAGAIPRRSPPHSQQRHLHSTPRLSKKSKPKASANDTPDPRSSSPSASASSASSPSSSSSDPFDFSTLESGIAQAQSRLADSLTALRPGGRIAPESVEAVRVQLPDKTVVKLGEVATVVPRGGRALALLLADGAHAKPVAAALLRSPLGLNATAPPAGDGEAGSGLELRVSVPPPTAESRAAAKGVAADAGEKALAAVRAARQALHKRHRAMELDKSARKDDVRRAEAKMEEVVKRANEAVKKTVEAARKALDA